MTRLVVTADAEADTTAILECLEGVAGVAVAHDYGRRIRTTIERLLKLPRSGSPRPALARDTRIAIVAPYILIYDYVLASDTFTLLRILHERRNITRELVRG